MDRRIKYTQKIIKDTLIELLNQKDISKITVSEICALADINRATFYRYYLDAYDLLDKIKEEFVSKLITVSPSEDEEYNISSFALNLLQVFLEEKDLVKVLFNNKSDSYFLNDVLNISYERCKNKWSNETKGLKEEEIEYASIFIFNGALGIINYWVKSDFADSAEEIAKTIEDLSYYGITRFIHKK